MCKHCWIRHFRAQLLLSCDSGKKKEVSRCASRWEGSLLVGTAVAVAEREQLVCTLARHSATVAVL